MKKIGVLFALELEARLLLERIHARRIANPTHAIYEGTLGGVDVRVGVSGPGPERASSAAGRILSLGDTRLFIVTGFAGGLDPALAAGDLVIAESVTRFDSTQEVIEPCDARLLALTTWISGGRSCRTVRGSILSSCRVVSSPAEKEALFQASGCRVVDTESGAAGERAAAAGTPWIAVRSVIDTASDAVPYSFARMTSEDGRVNHPIAVRAGLRHPLALAKFACASRLARTHLVAFLETYLQRVGRAHDQ